MISFLAGRKHLFYQLNAHNFCLERAWLPRGHIKMNNSAPQQKVMECSIERRVSIQAMIF